MFEIFEKLEMYLPYKSVKISGFIGQVVSLAYHHTKNQWFQPCLADNRDYGKVNLNTSRRSVAQINPFPLKIVLKSHKKTLHKNSKTRQRRLE